MFVLSFSPTFFVFLRLFLDFPRESLKNSDPGRNRGVFLSNAWGIHKLRIFKGDALPNFTQFLRSFT